MILYYNFKVYERTSFPVEIAQKITTSNSQPNRSAARSLHQKPKLVKKRVNELPPTNKKAHLERRGKMCTLRARRSTNNTPLF
jgi:hypothetical protein